MIMAKQESFFGEKTANEITNRMGSSYQGNHADHGKD